MAVANGLIKNKSFFYILPLLNISSYSNIKQTYLGDVKEDVFDDKIYILCSNNNNFIEANNNFIKKYNTEDGIIYMLKVPDIYKDDYFHFLKGKYSKFSKKAKELLCKQACKNSIKSPHETQIYGILYKTEARKRELEKSLDVKLDIDAEYGSIFNSKSEVYDGRRV